MGKFWWLELKQFACIHFKSSWGFLHLSFLNWSSLHFYCAINTITTHQQMLTEIVKLQCLVNWRETIFWMLTGILCLTIWRDLSSAPSVLSCFSNPWALRSTFPQPSCQILYPFAWPKKTSNRSGAAPWSWQIMQLHRELLEAWNAVFVNVLSEAQLPPWPSPLIPLLSLSAPSDQNLFLLYKKKQVRGRLLPVEISHSFPRSAAGLDPNEPRDPVSNHLGSLRLRSRSNRSAAACLLQAFPDGLITQDHKPHLLDLHNRGGSGTELL